MGRAYCLALTMFIGGTACSVLIDAEPRQCESDSECTSRGGQFKNSECLDGFCSVVEQEVLAQQPENKCSKDADCDISESCVDKECVSRWACVGQLPDAGVDDEIQVVLPVASSFGDPVPSVPGKACRNIDPSCSSPVVEAVSDEQGLFHLVLPADFTGYFEVVVPPFFPMLYYFPSDLRSGASLPVLSLTPTQLIEGLGLAVGAAPNPERGHILLAAKSCVGPAPGVHLESAKADDETIPFYVLDGIPSRDLEVTTTDGSGGFLNFPVGNSVLNLSVGSLDELASLSLTVRPGYITSVSFDPAGVQ